MIYQQLLFFCNNLQLFHTMKAATALCILLAYKLEGYYSFVPKKENIGNKRSHKVDIWLNSISIRVYIDFFINFRVNSTNIRVEIGFFVCMNIIILGTIRLRTTKFANNMCNYCTQIKFILESGNGSYRSHKSIKTQLQA